MNCGETEARPVLGPAGNKATTRTMETHNNKQVSKPQRKVVEKPPQETTDEAKGKRAPSLPAVHPTQQSRPSILLKSSSLSMNASCSSEASTDSTYSRASTGRMITGRRSCAPPTMRVRRRQCGSKLDVGEKVGVGGESELGDAGDAFPAKKRCAWVTPNTDPCYVSFHDEEWGVPIHDDKKLFELLVLSTALAELTWPAILNKRHMFREVFLDFDPIAVSKLNEKKILTPGSTASSLLSELKLRAIIDNARQMSKVIDEFGSFDKYIWDFVNHKPIVSHFRYPRQVPIKTSKADAISKDLVRRGFRGVGPTVVYSFMQVAGITNDHLISCFRFHDCVAESDPIDKDGTLKAKVEEKQHEDSTELGLARAIDDLDLSVE
ncbi:hypothetical protein RHMOL_Rhmol08G0276700 [Rhododendron molle]|uniref:Uncharacterized protein n=1 Tax=Rhododendron molle TaxID=49168 RepID=A0ACC0MT42_RHOML|nr:hypothetical protein RHMOL_Rhmol08G0276700 [Rhododendron molle]